MEEERRRTSAARPRRPTQRPATVASDNGAHFTVTVTGTSGSVTSNAATLTVNAPGSTVHHHAAGQQDRNCRADGDV